MAFTHSTMDLIWRVRMGLLSKFEVLTVICRRNIFNEST